jgi:hypothetical protein
MPKNERRRLLELALTLHESPRGYLTSGNSRSVMYGESFGWRLEPPVTVLAYHPVVPRARMALLLIASVGWAFTW